MQPTIYSRQRISILVLFDLMIFSGGACLKSMESAYGPASNASCDLSEEEDGTSFQSGSILTGDQKMYSSDEEESIEDQSDSSSYYEVECSNDRNELWSNPYAYIEHALVALDDYALSNGQAFTNEEKESIEKHIIQVALDCITELQAAGISPIEMVEGMITQLARGNKQERRLEVVGDAENEPTKCAICFESLKDAYRLTALPCAPTHAFHDDCIKQWVNTHGPNLCTCARIVWYLYKKLPCPTCGAPFSPSGLGLTSDYSWTPSPTLLGIDERKKHPLKVAEDAQNELNALNECPICLCDLKDRLTVLPCHSTHVFHKDCITQWVSSQRDHNQSGWLQKILLLWKKPSCPICRIKFSPSALDLVY